MVCNLSHDLPAPENVEAGTRQWKWREVAQNYRVQTELHAAVSGEVDDGDARHAAAIQPNASNHDQLCSDHMGRVGEPTTRQRVTHQTVPRRRR